MTKILFVLSFIVMIGVAGYAWTNGIFTQIFTPQTHVLQVTGPIASGDTFSAKNLEVASVALSKVGAKDLTFANSLSTEDILAEAKKHNATRSLKKGDYLTVADFSEAEKIYVLRARIDIAVGDSIDTRNIEVVEQGQAPQEGSVIFHSEKGAKSYLEEATNTRASTALKAGETIVSADLTNATGFLYLLELRHSLARGAEIKPADVKTTRVTGDGLPKGAIAFPTEAAANLFLTLGDKLNALHDLQPGATLSFEDVTRDGVPGAKQSKSDLPVTMKDLMAYETAHPGDVAYVDDTLLVGEKPQEGAQVDLWIETGATNGPFATASLKKIRSNLLVHAVTVAQADEAKADPGSQDPAASAEKTSSAETDTATGQADQSSGAAGSAPSTVYWVDMGAKANAVIKQARSETPPRLAFLISNDKPLGDFIGNGAVCVDDSCSVNSEASNDLMAIRSAIKAPADEPIMDAQDDHDPLHILDGVDMNLEKALIEKGYARFADIARWEDLQIPVLKLELHVPSKNLLIYIRQQARNIVNNAQKSRQELGMSAGGVGEAVAAGGPQASQASAN